MSKLYISTLVCLAALSQIMFAGNNNTNAEGHYDALYTETIPVIDGYGNDTCWDKAEWAPIDKVWIGDPVDSSDYTGNFKAMWTKDRLYFLIRIVDDSLRLQSPDVSSVCNIIYEYDCVEIFIDENHSRDKNYTGTYKAFAYHMDTAHNICYYFGSPSWVKLDDHINYQMHKVAENTYDYEYEVKVFDDTYKDESSIPVTLYNDKLMGLSLAYNDNDMGSTRQNMIGSKFVAGDTDNARNISYYNASAFGEIQLVGGDSTTILIPSSITHLSQNINIKMHGDQLLVDYSNESINGNINIQIFDIIGKEVRNTSSFKTAKSINHTFDISDLQKGIYIIKVSMDGSSETKKVLIY